jgi:hypothetical protein
MKPNFDERERESGRLFRLSIKCTALINHYWVTSGCGEVAYFVELLSQVWLLADEKVDQVDRIM